MGRSHLTFTLDFCIREMRMDEASVRVPTKTQKLDLALDDDDGKLSKSEEESSSDEPPDSDMDSD